MKLSREKNSKSNRNSPNKKLKKRRRSKKKRKRSVLLRLSRRKLISRLMGNQAKKESPSTMTKTILNVTTTFPTLVKKMTMKTILRKPSQAFPKLLRT
jgi:hypothetical protein